MLARVKQDFRWKTVVAFSGFEYTKTEWRKVPAGLEEQAKGNPFLELKDGDDGASAEVREKLVSKELPPSGGSSRAEHVAKAKPTAEAKLDEMVSSEPIAVNLHAEPESSADEPEKKVRTYKKKE